MKTICKFACLLSRYALGLVFFVFGLNFFFHFMPMPAMEGKAAEFIMALFNSGYVMQMVKVSEVITGLLLLTGMYVPWALVFITPVLVNIVAFHTFLAPEGAGMAYFMLLCWAILVWCYRQNYKGLCTRKADCDCKR